jgi:phage/plasmid primase-like uncharacterized protein
MTRVELCEALAVDYATRAKILSITFEAAYNKYLKRCEIRTYENLFQQFSHGNLLTLTSNVQKKYSQNEYIITVSDDDCEDGVCKL